MYLRVRSCRQSWKGSRTGTKGMRGYQKMPGTATTILDVYLSVEINKHESWHISMIALFKC